MRFFQRKQTRCPKCRCNKSLLFEPYPLKDMYGRPLLRFYHHGSNHFECKGVCGAKSRCPYCSGKEEIGYAYCVNRECRGLLFEGIRDAKTGKITIIKAGDYVGPIYESHFPSKTCLRVIRRG